MTTAASPSLAFWGHPFSSYCQKVLIALDENAIPFELRLLGGYERIAAEHSRPSTRRSGR